MQKDVFDLDSAPDARDYEKLSYGKFAYKQVQRLRRKGKRRGIEVPSLGYELSKPEKPRIVFWIVAIISAVLFVGILVGIAFLFNELVKMSSMFKGMNDVFKVVFDPKTFALSAGLSTIPALFILMAYLLLLLAFLLPLGLAIYFYRFVREIFYMAKCSKEEFAKGNIVSSRITGLVVTLLATALIFIALLIELPANARWLLWIVFVGIAIVIGGLLALILIEKAKNKKWFETLPEDKKKNYLEHERALRRVKSRLRFERDIWNGI